jgi:hypothetical protein
MAPITRLRGEKTFYLNHIMLINLGSDQTKVHGNINFNTSKLAIGVSGAHKCIIIGSRCNVSKKPNYYA